MVNLIKNATTQGIYILTDTAGAWVAANTPGNADLALLTLGTSYIYFSSIVRFEHQQTHNYESDTQRGWRTWPSAEGKMAANTAGHERDLVSLTVEDTETTAEYIEFMGKYYNRTDHLGAAYRLYLVKQTASESFRKFPDYTPNATLKNYLPVIIRGVNCVETGNSDRQTITLALEAIWS